MGASVTLNLIIGEGHVSTLTNRLRHWGLIVRSNPSAEVATKKDSTALE
jgi:hypothetical protein